MHAGPSGENPFQMPHIAEVRLESFRRAAASDLPAPADPPHLLLLLSDGSVLAYQAFVPAPGQAVRFARMRLPLLTAYAGTAVQPKGSASARMTRFDNLGDGAGLVHRCQSLQLSLCLVTRGLS